jgi:hypothetical protein
MDFGTDTTKQSTMKRYIEQSLIATLNLRPPLTGIGCPGVMTIPSHGLALLKDNEPTLEVCHS